MIFNRFKGKLVKAFMVDFRSISGVNILDNFLIEFFRRYNEQKLYILPQLSESDAKAMRHKAGGT